MLSDARRRRAARSHFASRFLTTPRRRRSSRSCGRTTANVTTTTPSPSAPKTRFRARLLTGPDYGSATVGRGTTRRRAATERSSPSGRRSAAKRERAGRPTRRSGPRPAPRRRLAPGPSRSACSSSSRERPSGPASSLELVDAAQGEDEILARDPERRTRSRRRAARSTTSSRSPVPGRLLRRARRAGVGDGPRLVGRPPRATYEPDKRDRQRPRRRERPRPHTLTRRPTGDGDRHECGEREQRGEQERTARTRPSLPDRARTTSRSSSVRYSVVVRADRRRPGADVGHLAGRLRGRSRARPARPRACRAGGSSCRAPRPLRRRSAPVLVVGRGPSWTPASSRRSPTTTPAWRAAIVQPPCTA